MFQLISKNSLSERPIAWRRTMIRWWEWLRAPIVQKWKPRGVTQLDATETHNRRVERTAWEALLAVEGF